LISATDLLRIHDYDADPDRIKARYGASVAAQELFDPGVRVDASHARRPSASRPADHIE
jgi:hypothetical protein